jgi:tRNA-2-methylthio-N6-dimethylallyladenosine synthase
MSGQLVGRSPYMQAVHVDGAGLDIGSIVKLKITKGHAYSLAGVVSEGALT